MTAYIVMGAIIIGLGVWLFFSIKGAIGVKQLLKESNRKNQALEADRKRLQVALEDIANIEKARIQRNEIIQNGDSDIILELSNELLNTSTDHG